jgi:curved DNA-binding protein CbpA
MSTATVPGPTLPTDTAPRDCFALLGQPRQPWIDPETLRAAFHTLSFELHPDRIHNRPEPERQAVSEQYAEMNRAYQTLRDPKERLGHLLELERGVRPANVQQVAGPSADLFFQVSQLCRGVDAFLSARSQLTSPLLKAQSFAEGLEWTDRLQNLQGAIGGLRITLEEELKTINVTWQNSSPHREEANGDSQSSECRSPRCLERLEVIYRQLSFIVRWISQLNERIVRLSE